MDSLTNIVKSVRTFLSGKKSYLLGAIMVLTALEKYVTGATTLSQFLTTVQGLVGFNGAAVVFIRAAISKVTTTYSART
jgi:hypothetical protein